MSASSMATLLPENADSDNSLVWPAANLELFENVLRDVQGNCIALVFT